jgi:flagellar biosynthesis/type III secretory pathway chaperone
MALNDMLYKVKDTAFNNVKDKTGQVGNNKKDLLSPVDAKKEIKVLVEKKMKLYSYIGMEIYDMHIAGQIDIPQIKEFCLQTDELSRRIKELETKLETMQAANHRNSVCICGCKLSKNSKFCPSCGKPTLPDMITCTCGKLLNKNMSFCDNCGTNLQNLINAQHAVQHAVPSQKIECVCGALINPDQPICMECGRRTPRMN